MGQTFPSVAESSTDEPAGSVVSMARTALMALARLSAFRVSIES